MHYAPRFADTLRPPQVEGSFAPKCHHKLEEEFGVEVSLHGILTVEEDASKSDIHADADGAVDHEGPGRLGRERIMAEHKQHLLPGVLVLCVQFEELFLVALQAVQADLPLGSKSVESVAQHCFAQLVHEGSVGGPRLAPLLLHLLRRRCVVGARHACNALDLFLEPQAQLLSPLGHFVVLHQMRQLRLDWKPRHQTPDLWSTRDMGPRTLEILLCELGVLRAKQLLILFGHRAHDCLIACITLARDKLRSEFPPILGARTSILFTF
mmetsp:Transcript_44588/g.105652  ORF Transcript_44588/g.105652 Transcript_44588/m.105652 type:complete len:267 (-) Transcript_44588:197-997(-)